jgi:hypothetical protein
LAPQLGRSRVNAQDVSEIAIPLFALTTLEVK